MDEALPDGWTVWNDEPGGQLVLAFRPDVFDSSAFPPACLPTITVARGGSPDQLPERRARSASWFRAFYLEPVVRVRDADATYETRTAAVEAAHDLASAFVDGEVDYRGAYQQPREAYLDELDRLVGASERSGGSDRNGENE